MAARVESLLTIADLDSLPDDGNRYEIIEGELFVSRAPSLSHQKVVLNISTAIKLFLDEVRIGAVWPGPGVLFSDFSGVMPDVVYVSNERIQEIASGDRIIGAPDLVVEVLSPGGENERRDRKAKRSLYRKYGVEEFWVVDPEKRIVQIYRAARLRLTATHSVKDSVTTPLLAGFRCRVRDIFR